MADPPSSPVNPFIVLCLLIVLGAGGFAVWKEVSPDSFQADSAQPEEESPPVTPAVDPLTEGVASTEPEPSPPPAPESLPPSQPEATAPQADPFPNAIARAEQAQNLSQSAQSQDDWRLVLNRRRQAIALMETVPSSSPNYGQVAAKLADYRRNQAYAESKVTQALPDNTVTGQVVVGGEPEAEEPTTTDGSEPGEGTTATSDEPSSGDDTGATASEGGDTNNANAAGRRVFSAPIVRRSGGTPVIQVLFNDRYTVEMIVDTGASGTVITQRVAQTLGVQPTGRTNVSTASAQNVSFLLGQVESIKVDGVGLENVVVAIAGPGLDTGLLGHDFFGRYDVTVRSDVVEFHER
ncbi:MAG: retropepsin-like aspartic protease [Leptolyngbyaceae bacterium]|nr:retropepsin-like aspartic protease [Leptolyngbyaceae bacterium]